MKFTRRLRGLGPDQWVSIGLGILLLLFLVALTILPSGVGRGGR
jgi:hypothetical protein